MSTQVNPDWISKGAGGGSREGLGEKETPRHSCAHFLFRQHRTGSPLSRPLFFLFSLKYESGGWDEEDV